MPGLSKHFPDFTFSSNKVAPNEVDQLTNYWVHNPGTSDVSIGTVNSATAAATVVLTNKVLDYPRNILFTLLGVAGGMGGTVTITGLNQFGSQISESIGFASAAGGGTAAGTKIFASVATATLDGIAGLGGTAIGTAKLGYAIGTAAGIVALFGLPVKVKAESDVKAVTWVSNTVTVALNGGTISSAIVGTANHTFNGTSVVAITDRFNVRIKSTYDYTYDQPIYP